MFGLPPRKGYCMKINGILPNRHDMHNIAAELGISTNDVLFKNGILTLYNTSESCQEIIDDNALTVFVAMALNISPKQIETPVQTEEEPTEMDFDILESKVDDI